MLAVLKSWRKNSEAKSKKFDFNGHIPRHCVSNITYRLSMTTTTTRIIITMMETPSSVPRMGTSGLQSQSQMQSSQGGGISEIFRLIETIT